MRALILTTEFPPGPGGIGTHSWELARHLVKRGWEITVAAPQDYASSEEIEDFNRSQPFPVLDMGRHPLLPFRMLQRWRSVSTWLKQNTPDVIIASGSRFVWMTAVLITNSKLPWVAVGHGSEFCVKNAARKYLTQWAYQKATGVICVSEFTMQQMRESGIYPDKCSVIPNGADPDSFYILPKQEVESFRAKLGFAKTPLVLTVGNVTERKGQEVVIKSLPQVIKEIPDVIYMIVGLPTKRKELEEQARQLGILDHIHFFGRVDSKDLLHFLNICDLFVMTSRNTADGDFEGYGIAVVEAALCGKPSIVAGNSGLAEAVVNNETAFVVPENDENATAEAIIKMLKNSELRRQMGENAQRQATAEQTWANRIAHYDQFLRGLLESKESQKKVFTAAG